MSFPSGVMSQSNLAKTVSDNRDLLIAALNKNQVTFAQIAKSAESISNGSLKLRLDGGGKVFVFEYLGKKVVLEMNNLRLRGLKYLNDILIDDILTKGQLDEVYRILEQVQEELLNKADKEHTHEISDVNTLQEQLDNKAEKDHKHEISDVNGLQDELDQISIKGELISEIQPWKYDISFPQGSPWTWYTWDNRFIIKLSMSDDKFTNHSVKIIIWNTNNTPGITYESSKFIMEPGTFSGSRNGFTADTEQPYIARFTVDVRINEYVNISLFDNGVETNEKILIGINYGFPVYSNINYILTFRAIIDAIYPVGSIYMSMNNIDPATLFSGLMVTKWVQIENRFLLCSTGESGKKGGSSYINGSNMPAHNHLVDLVTNESGAHFHKYCLSEDRNGYPDGSGDTSSGLTVRESYWRGNKQLSYNATTSITSGHTHIVRGYTGGSGDSLEYWQPYMTCYCWYRVS